MNEYTPTAFILLLVQNLRREHLIHLPCHLAKGGQYTLNEGNSSKGSMFISKHLLIIYLCSRYFLGAGDRVGQKVYEWLPRAEGDGVLEGDS